ncbi:MAG: hypothetical protein M9913_14110 [Bryobacteraceae bacterium]|nr:hypothetical protein [Bryobacteraceae bacterium]
MKPIVARNGVFDGEFAAVFGPAARGGKEGAIEGHQAGDDGGGGGFLGVVAFDEDLAGDAGGRGVFDGDVGDVLAADVDFGVPQPGVDALAALGGDVVTAGGDAGEFKGAIGEDIGVPASDGGDGGAVEGEQREAGGGIRTVVPSDAALDTEGREFAGADEDAGEFGAGFKVDGGGGFEVRGVGVVEGNEIEFGFGVGVAGGGEAFDHEGGAGADPEIVAAGGEAGEAKLALVIGGGGMDRPGSAAAEERVFKGFEGDIDALGWFTVLPRTRPLTTAWGKRSISRRRGGRRR